MADESHTTNKGDEGYSSDHPAPATAPTGAPGSVPTITPASMLGKLRRVREMASQYGMADLFEEEIVWIIDYIKAKEGRFK